MNLLPVPEGVSTYAGLYDGLAFFITCFVVGWWTFAAFGFFIAFLKFYKTRGHKAQYVQGIGWGQTKVLWIIMIFVVGSDLLIDIKTADVWSKIETSTPANPTANDIHVKVTGSMWNWVFTYAGPDGILNNDDDVVVEEAASELVVPVNTNVVFDLTSRDVLHNFFVREFRFKQDVIPGRTITRWFNATKEGKYDLACAEICGANHGKMRNYVKVVSREEYDSYVKNLYAENALLNGKKSVEVAQK